MAHIPSGPYIISTLRGEPQSLTSEGSEPGAPVVLLPPTGVPGQQEWHVEQGSNGAITLRNVKSGKYAGYEGEPQENALIVAVDTPTEFVPRPGSERNVYKLEVPGTGDLGLGLSLLKVFPQRAALRPFDQVPEWHFQFLE
ncbi:hypothetical protein FS749_008802 [Ceratobasidium sp. UAMH 11750]|nr:hypothetical protein FS749_008802 [Ceratobasidium sp. UAMH 11750]